MGLVVQKFGGKLLESPERIKRAAAHIIATQNQGDDPVVVVSAPGRVTDYFIKLAGRVANEPDPREMDMLLSVGERLGMSLLALAINDGGKARAVSFTGSQVGIITDTRHGDASIIEVKGYRIREAIAQGVIPIVAGFQGISTDKEITTLGRGGSDATAVALAAAVGADRCELIKESGGVFSADPLSVDSAVLLPELDYSTLEHLTVAGAKVVQPRAAGLAREHQVTLSINAPDGRRGTLVSDRTLSRMAVAGLTLKQGVLLGKVDSHHLGEYACLQASPADGLSLQVGAQDGRSCDLITIVGWAGRLEDKPIAAALNCIGSQLIALFRSPGSVALAVEADEGKVLLRGIHQKLIDEGFIERG